LKIDILFTLSRLITTLVRPVFLIFIISFLKSDEESKIIAFIFTVGITFFQFLSCDAHLNYYKDFFKKKTKHNLIFSYRSYINFCLGLCFLSFPVLAVVNFFFFKSVYLSFGVSLMIIFEKIMDEFNRFKIYTKDFRSWSKYVITMYFIPPFLATLFGLFSNYSISQIYILISLTVYFGLSVKLVTTLPLILYPIKKMIMHTIEFYFSRITFIIANVLHGHSIIVGRYFVLFYFEFFFSTYVALMSIMGIIPTTIDMFYTAYRRKYFLSNPNEPFDILKAQRFMILLFFSSMVTCLVCFIFLGNEIVAHLNIFHCLIFVCLLGIIYVCSLLFYESIFWIKTINDRILVDAFFYFFVLMFFLAIKLFSLDLFITLILIFISMLLRTYALYYSLKSK